MSSLPSISVLIAAIVILQLAQSLLGVQLPLAMEADGMTRTGQGFVAAAYSAGFMLGAWLGLRLMARVGHIRVFAACGALATGATLSLFAADHVVLWMLVRFVMGAAIALMFAAAESWMNAVLGAGDRGAVISLYHVAAKVALAFGAFLAFGAVAGSAAPFMIAAAITSLAIVPICLTTRVPPEPPRPQPLDVRDLFRLAPASVLTAAAAGTFNTGVLALAPIYASVLYGPAAATVFVAAGWIGSLLLQWPAGMLSDRMDRRLVIAGLAGLAGVSAATLAVGGSAFAFWAAATLFALWGAGALSFHGVGVAHMADRAPNDQIPRATAGLLFIWAGGSIVGPLVLGGLVDLVGVRGIFGFAAVGMTLLVAAMLARRSAKEPATDEEKGRFSNPPVTSAAGAEFAFGEGDAREGGQGVARF